MLLIGLTGGIASGKTLVSDRFARHGAPVIDADLLAREVVEPGGDGLNALVARFGKTILQPDGALDRAALRAIVFGDPAARTFVDATLHPLIRALSDERIAAARADGHAYAIYAVPLLVETAQAARFDRVLVVDVPESVQIERLRARDGSSEVESRAILAAQATREARLAVADDVIVNDGDVATTLARVDELHALYTRLAGVGDER